MADDVIAATVIVDVEGNTKPLKDDVRRAAVEAGKAIDDGIGEGSGGSAITDNIVDQVSAAEKPAGKEAQKTGRAIANGVEIGAKDIDVTSQINKNLRDAEAPLREQAARLGRTISRATRQAREAAAGQAIDNTLVRIRLDNDEFSRSLAGAKIEWRAFNDSLKVDNEPLKRSLSEAQQEWSKFGDNLNASLDRSFSQGIFSRLLPGGGGGGGFFSRLLPGTKEGEASGQKVGEGMTKSLVKAGIIQAFLGIAAKGATIGPLIALGVRAAAPVIVGLTSQVSALGTALAGLGAVGAASFATMIPAVGALKLAFTGMDAKAKKALTEQFKQASGDLVGFKERVRNEMVPALLDATKTVSKLAPEINKLGTDAAKAGGKIANVFAKMLVGRKEEIGNIFGNSSKVMTAFGTAGSRALDVIINALDALQPLVMQVVGLFSKGMKNLTDSFNKDIDNGTFLRTMTRWFEAGKDLMAIFKNIGIVLKNFFGAATSASDGFLDSFRDVTQEWANWSNSVAGQNKLKEMFEDAVPVVTEVWGLLGDIAGLFTESFTGDTGGLVDFIKTIRESVIPGIQDFQKALRDSGIQEALFDLAESLLRLFEGSGGATVQAFLATLTVLVDTFAEMTNVLGPLLIPLASFIGMFKALQVSKSLFSGLLSLPAMLTGIVSPAKNAEKALQGANTQAGAIGKNAPVGKVAGFTGALSRLAGGATTAATALIAVRAVSEEIGDAIPISQEAVDRWVASLAQGKSLVDAMSKPVTLPGAEGLTKEQRDRLGGGTPGLVAPPDVNDFQRSIDLLKSPLRFLVGVGDAKDKFIAAYQGINDYLEKTGDIEGARKAFDELNASIQGGGVDVKKTFGDQVYAIEKALTSVQATAQEGINLTGDFSNITTGMETFAQDFDTNVAKKLDDIAKNPLFTNAKTGGLNKAGFEARARVIAEVDMDSVNGVDNAISEATEGKIRKIYLDPDKQGYIDKTGQLTEKGLKQVVKLTVEGVEENKEEVARQGRALGRLMAIEANGAFTGTFTPGQTKQAGRDALHASVPKINLKDVPAQIEQQVGEMVIPFRAKLREQGFSKEDIDSLTRDKVVKFLVEAETKNASDQLTTLLGKDWSAQIKASIPKADYIDVEGQLLHFKNGKWEAVVGVAAETARAKNSISQVLVGPGGTPYLATITVDDKGTAHTTATKIDTAAEDRDTKVDVDDKGTAKSTGNEIRNNIPTQRTVTVTVETRIGSRPRWDATKGRWVSGAEDLANSTVKRMVLPEGGGDALVSPSEPSMISMGGPTTMGYGSNLGPVGLGIATRAGISIGAAQVIGSPTIVKGAGQEPGGDTIIINNYYPEPERVSDSIAMSLRAARFM